MVKKAKAKAKAKPKARKPTKPKLVKGKSVVTVAAHTEKHPSGKVVHHKAYSYVYGGGLGQHKRERKPKAKKKK